MGEVKHVQSHFLVWDQHLVENMVVLDQIVGFKDDHLLNMGVSLEETFPDNVIYEMDREAPENTILLDTLYNTDLVIVGSEKLKEFLVSRKLNSVEYLPVKIRDHKKRLIKQKYFIIHPIEPIECLDAKKSGAEYSKIAKQKINVVKRLVIDDANIPKERKLLKIKNFHRVVLIREELAKEIGEVGFTGIRWIKIDEYPEE